MSFLYCEPHRAVFVQSHLTSTECKGPHHPVEWSAHEHRTERAEAELKRVQVEIRLACSALRNGGGVGHEIARLEGLLPEGRGDAVMQNVLPDHKLIREAVRALGKVAVDRGITLPVAVQQLEAAWPKLQEYFQEQIEKKYEDPRHIIEFDEHGWVLQHPLRCRPNLLDCPLTKEAPSRFKAIPAGLSYGKYPVELDGKVLIYGEKLSD